jgi:hypothetical protein
MIDGNLKSENSQDYALETPKKLYVHEFGFWLQEGQYFVSVFTAILASVYAHYSTLLHVTLLRFLYVGGCRGIEPRTALQTAG